LLPVVLLPLMLLGGVYRHPVRHFSLRDAMRLVTVTTFGWSVAYLVLVGLLHRNASFFLAPMSLLISLACMGAIRVWRRESWRRTHRNQQRDKFTRIAVYGAGRRGNALVSFLENGFGYAKVVGFLDDNDAQFRGRAILGHMVLGSERDLNTVHAVHSMDQLWLTFEPDTHKRRRLAHWCQANGVRLVVVPNTPPFDALCFPKPCLALSDAEGEAVAEDETVCDGNRAAA
jgi:FlaA1/EpsC-like NDP-sugar epimerase